MSFGQRLRELREVAKLRLKDVADEMEWSAVYVCDIERGHRSPPAADKIRKLARFINADMGELILLAGKERKKIELDIAETRPRAADLAMVLARSWDEMTEETAEQLIQYLRGGTSEDG